VLSRDGDDVEVSCKRLILDDHVLNLSEPCSSWFTLLGQIPAAVRHLCQAIVISM